MSSAYHPQTDGQTERVNQCLEAYLRCFVQSCPRQWSSWLSLAEFWYNTCYHTALGNSPFEVLYGHAPSQFGLVSGEQCSVPELQDLLSNRQQMLQQVKMHLQRAQDRMKKQADKGHMERTFKVGDRVFLKLQPFCHTSVAARSSRKLTFRFFGPFDVIKQVNPVAYELALPSGSAIHPVFHVSQLKPVVGIRVPVCSVLPDFDTGLQIPEQVMDSRLFQKGGKVISQVLVRWSGWPEVLTTWEDEQALRQQFPGAPAWGQAVSQGGKDVNNTTTGAKLSTGEEEPDAGVQVRRSSRVPKSNTKYYGKMWTR
jgi:hypothetical protein